MGNCLRRQSSSVVWAGDDWGSLTSRNPFADDDDMSATERQSLFGETGAFSSSPSATGASTGIREVKIKISKKELEELLGRVDMRGLSASQVLARLKDSAYRYGEHHRSWRPALQSIPEVN